MRGVLEGDRLRAKVQALPKLCTPGAKTGSVSSRIFLGFVP